MRPLQPDDVLAVRPGLIAESVDADTLCLLGERERFIVSFPGAAFVTASVDGVRSVGEVVALARARVFDPSAWFVLQELVERGHLVRAEPRIPGDEGAFWHAMGADAAAAAPALASRPVSVYGVTPRAPVAEMNEALAHAGVRVAADAATSVVITDDCLRPELADIDRDARARGAPWFLVSPVGTRPLIGPLFAHDEGPCWECLVFWLRGNRPVEELVRRVTGADAPISPPRGAIGTSVRVACGLASIAVARWITRDGRAVAPAPAEIVSLDLASFETHTHAVARRPQCPACGDPTLTSKRQQRRVDLKPIEKAHVEDGGYRRQSPRATFERYRHLISPITGPVSYVTPVPSRDTELRAVYASGYLACPHDAVPTTNTFDKACAGKGRTADQAKVSALCEALERYSGVYRGDEARVRATKTGLDAPAVAPPDIHLFSETQYRSRRTGGGRARGGEWIAEPFDPDAAIDWAYAWSLTHDERRYVPFTHCYSEAPPESGTRYARACGNGAAAGTCIEEAILQGVFELVERDAVAIWWYNRAVRPAIDLRTFQDPYFHALEADYAKLGWSIWVLDLTHDLGIPVYAALGHHRGEDRFSIGFGCHLERRLAVQRALTELNQLFDPVGSRRAPWDIERLGDRSHLFPSAELAFTAATAPSPRSGADLRADIEECTRRLWASGLELIVVDKTRPDIDLSVAQVIVPGLRHFWPRFGPGRLYTVPVLMGWTPRPLAEDELTTTPLLV